MCERVLEKVTAFITRRRGDRTELLLFRHPHAGIQIPAGTVEPSERSEDAALRETWEETGISDPSLARHIGSAEEPLEERERAVVEGTSILTRPQEGCLTRGHMGRGSMVTVKREEKGFTQVTCDEWDRFPDPHYVTFSITGWVPDRCLARKKRRHFYHLTADHERRQAWPKQADSHVFELFWASIRELPPLHPSSAEWLTFALEKCGYHFSHEG